MWPFPRQGKASQYGIANFGLVMPRVYRSALPNLTSLAKLRQQLGLRTVIDLRDELTPKKADDYAKEVQRLGLDLFQFPMSDKAPVDPLSIKLVVSKIATSNYQPLLVHCKGGRHRTGGVIATLRVQLCGWSAQMAYNEAVDYGFYGWNGHRHWETYIKGLIL